MPGPCIHCKYDHPSAAQFLVTVNCLSFYNLARPPKSGNSPAQLVNALLSSPIAENNYTFSMQDIIEDMLEVGNIDDAGCVIQLCLNSDHNSCVVETSDSLLHGRICG